MALRNRLATLDEADIRESDEVGRDAVIWKLDMGRSTEVVIQTKTLIPKSNLRRSSVCIPLLETGRADTTGTMEASAGAAEWLANLSNRFWRRRRYSSSLDSR